MQQTHEESMTAMIIRDEMTSGKLNQHEATEHDRSRNEINATHLKQKQHIE